MSTREPRCNLLVIRSPDIDRAVTFYQSLGLSFKRHAHGSGPEHHSAEMDGFVFEIYPQLTPTDPICEIRLGFLVDNVDSIIPSLVAAGGKVIANPTNSQWGRRAVIRDLDGNHVELVNAK